MNNSIKQLAEFLDNTPSPYQVITRIEQELNDFAEKTHTAKWQKLNEYDSWQLQQGGRYYVVRDDSSIILFVLGTNPIIDTGFKIIAAHTDSPCLRLKPNPVIASDGLLRLGVEIYGGPILATFADRDLSLAGRLSYRTKQGKITHQPLVFSQPLLRLPNLAIHLNRGVNDDGLKLQKQNELPLVLGQIIDQQFPQTTFLNLLAKQANIEAEQILTWDLAVYDTQKTSFWGINSEFYASSRLDNLASCHAGLRALLNTDSLASGNTLVCAFFDHEEVGSESHKGADGGFLKTVLQRISGVNHEDHARTLARSFLISADMAHAYQPNFPLAYEPEHKVFVNQGVVIKTNANQRYSSNNVSTAMFINWCQQADVPYQHYVQRCDLACGSTVGPMTAAHLGIRAVDVGNPMWAMHSIRESAGVFDHTAMIRVLTQFYSSAEV